MSETKWTLGPWKPHATGRARSGKPEHEIHWSDDGECIAEIVHGEPEAHLISAAPELYATLEDLHERLIRCMNDPISAAEAYDSFYQGNTLDVLAKARGEDA